MPSALFELLTPQELEIPTLKRVVEGVGTAEGAALLLSQDDYRMTMTGKVVLLSPSSFSPPPPSPPSSSVVPPAAIAPQETAAADDTSDDVLLADSPLRVAAAVWYEGDPSTTTRARRRLR
jgi:hypothetical protein